MQTLNTVSDFLQLWEHPAELSVAEIQERYHQRHPELFALYFREYVKGTPAERIAAALPRYPADLDHIRSVAARAPALMEPLVERASALFGITPSVGLQLLVGVYASNAWVDRQAYIGVAVERMPVSESSLTVVLAHELCHRFHFAWLKEAGYGWQRPITGAFWAYLEGIATYYSGLLCPGAPDEELYCYGDLVADATAWVTFAREHEPERKAAFRPLPGHPVLPGSGGVHEHPGDPDPGAGAAHRTVDGSLAPALNAETAVPATGTAAFL